jgi:hypothetical protein
VVVGRNDHYGGNFAQRLSREIQWFEARAHEVGLRAEWILVDYNPLPNELPLIEQLDWGQVLTRTNLRIRVITVSPEIHEAFHAPEIRKPVTLYEFAAKNAGIRRASGTFILVLNADLLLTPELVDSLHPARLDNRYFYRAQRVDFHGANSFSVDRAHLEAVAHQSFKCYLQGYNYPVLPASCEYVRRQVQAWQAVNSLRVLKDKAQTQLALSTGQPKLMRGLDKALHVNAAGDFTLMSREAWHHLQGYPEAVWSAVHTDALILYRAAALGLKQKILPGLAYHEDHPRRFPTYVNARVPELHTMYTLLNRAGLAWFQGLSLAELDAYAVFPSQPDWGFGKESLAEVQIN